MSGNNGGSKRLNDLIQELSGENVYKCYQCKRCTNGCPFVEYFDIPPHELMRRLQFGQDEACLTAKTTWLCASCQTCNTRCPQDIDVAHIFDIVKIEAQERGLKPAEPPVKMFYTAGLHSIKWFGRLYELGLMAEMYIRMFFAGKLDLKRVITKDVPLAIKMLGAGKLKIIPTIARGTQTEAVPQSADKKSIGYYPGCALHATGIEFGTSMEAVSEALDVQLIEPEGWVCCGTSPAHSSDHLLANAMPIENLALIERTGVEAVTVPCASCYSRFKMATEQIAHNPTLKQEVTNAVTERRGFSYGGGVEIQNVVDTLTDFVGLDQIEARVTRPLEGLKVVSYYGCLLTRPPKVTGDPHPEYPMGMDRIVETLGAQSLDWNYKTACCGGSLALSEMDMVLGMLRKIIEDARAAGAEAIVVACPLCHANLDMRQNLLGLEGSPMPIVYLTELMGLAFGLPPKSLGLGRHIVSTRPLVDRFQPEPA